MKKSKTILLSSLLFTLFIFQTTAQDCSCSESFEATVGTYEKNYSLFIYKVTEENKELYQAHTDLMRKKASEAENLVDCKSVLEQWLDFFRDGHAYIRISAKSEPKVEKITISEKQFKSDFKNKNYDKNPLLGIWQNGAYTAALIPNPKTNNTKRDYVGVIIETTNEKWSENEVKFELTTVFGTNYNASFMMSDHSPKSITAQQVSAGKLSFEGLGDWIKIWPQTKEEEPQNIVDLNYNKFHYAELDGIPYLRFPDFWTVTPEYVDSIMQANHEKLLAAEFIIVDVRDNGGGNDGTYYPILPYLLNGPIQIPNTGYWMSEYNIQQFLNTSDLKEKTYEEYTEEQRQTYDYLMSFKDSVYFEYPDNYFYTYEPDTLYTWPKKVIILVNEGCGSSCETFVYRANQSEKVVVYGQNTAGVVDGFNGLSKDIGCFKLTYPSSYRAMDLDKNPIDPYGIAPDVYINENIDALPYMIEHMKILIKNEYSGKK
ncbi:hypothetical protein GCM10011506_35840 [Marivirga lumbricoides]|uniref:Tail specific protease domain-containing protein n=1 Tax=Marivirga lumbricoides TaxID=1046115 RepID=A0ABQ1MV91_9BACT|nr:hypothetical protein GCM10011506_35840 [Marivirga lumbricoides]